MRKTTCGGGCGVLWMDRYEIGSTDPSFEEIKEYVSEQVERLVNAVSSVSVQTAGQCARYTNKKITEAVKAAKEYTDGAVEETLASAANYTDQAAANSVQEAKDYVDQVISGLALGNIEKAITDLRLDENGDLVAVFSDDTTETIGNVKSKVYVPHIDRRKVLTYTVEDNTGEPPEPVDLNPFDEWGPIDSEQEDSDFFWEGI